MRQILSLGILTSTLVALFMTASNANAEPLMTKSQYADYSVQYRCAEQLYHHDLTKKEEELIRIEDAFGLNDDNFDEFDELITEYERDDSLLDSIALRAQTECRA